MFYAILYGLPNKIKCTLTVFIYSCLYSFRKTSNVKLNYLWNTIHSQDSDHVMVIIKLIKMRCYFNVLLLAHTINIHTISIRHSTVYTGRKKYLWLWNILPTTSLHRNFHVRMGKTINLAIYFCTCDLFGTIFFLGNVWLVTLSQYILRTNTHRTPLSFNQHILH